jgi:hypothetical protein
MPNMPGLLQISQGPYIIGALTMSPQAIANPEDLERFARDLKQFNAQLRESMARLNGQFTRLGDI